MRRQYPNYTSSLPTFECPAEAMYEDDERTFAGYLVTDADATGFKKLILSCLASDEASTKHTHTKECAPS
jgi:hypothetical protein